MRRFSGRVPDIDRGTTLNTAWSAAVSVRIIVPRRNFGYGKFR